MDMYSGYTRLCSVLYITNYTKNLHFTLCKNIGFAILAGTFGFHKSSNTHTQALDGQKDLFLWSLQGLWVTEIRQSLEDMEAAVFVCRSLEVTVISH